ncbi:MAG: hypothetical protein R3C13_06665 [Hyphomonas sp.]|uniref:hypothetical protein n=1 Tax=Hyphomonas sp. TaxID=87 RepID=UPI0035295B65
MGLSFIVLASCVPTTKYRYVPVSEANFEAAQNGAKIPLVAHETALCFADGRTALVRDAEWTEAGICGQAHPPVGDDDGMRCYDWNALAGIGIPYESRSASVVPMAAVQIGKCDPESLIQ